MSEQTHTLSEVAQGTSEMLHDATAKTTQSVIAHTAKYNDAYSTIDKFVDSFWERMPYFCIALITFVIFYLLSKLFKLFKY